MKRCCPVRSDNPNTADVRKGLLAIHYGLAFFFAAAVALSVIVSVAPYLE